MNRFAVVCTVLATVILAPMSASAEILPPGSTVEGKTIGEWTAGWWNWVHSFGPEGNPVVDNAGILAVQHQSGPVFFIGGPVSTVIRHYDVPNDKYLLIPLMGAAYVRSKPAEEDPDWVRDQARARNDLTTALHFSLDGVAVPEAELFLHREETGFYTDVVVPGNYSKETPGAWDSSYGDGYWVMLEPLSVGVHELRFGGDNPYLIVTGTDDINVVPEPASLALLSMGALGLSIGWWRRRRVV